MSTDNDHAIFVRQEYRRVTAIDPLVKARNSAARELTIDTQMDQASAQALANAHLVENKQPQTWELVLDGADALPDFVGGPPSVIPVSARYYTDGRACKAFSVSSDYTNNTTTVQVRG